MTSRSQLTAGWPSVTEQRQAGRRTDRRAQADPQDGVHLLELALVAELLGLLHGKPLRILTMTSSWMPSMPTRQANGEARVRARVTP